MCAEGTQSISLLFEAGNQLSQTLDIEQIYMTLYTLLSQAMDCDELLVSGYSDQTQKITYEFYYSWAKETNVKVLPSISVTEDGTSAQCRVILTGESMMIPNYHLFSHNDTTPLSPYMRKDAQVETIEMKDIEVRSAIVIPMKLQGAVVGVVQIFSYRYNAYSDREFHLAGALTTQMAVARNNTFLYAQAAEELRQRSILQHQLEEERNQLEIRVQERTEELEQALRVRDHFLSNLSHELRTPLTSILGMSELLQYQIHGKLTSKQNRYVELIYSNSEHLMHLLSDLLDMASLSTGDLKLYKEWVPLDSILQSCLHYAQSRAEEKQIKVFVENHTRIDRVYIDPQRTKQILNNILNNAVKFTPKGLSIGFEIMFSFDQQMLEFVIWDQGSGISVEEQKRLTQPFTQGLQALQENQSGAGLGLALAKEIAEIHDGKIRIESQLGRGTLVTISLPYTCEEPDRGHGSTMQVTPERTDLLREMVSSMREKKILIADSDEPLCELLANYLDIFEVETIAVHDINQLVKRLQQEVPDLLMMDLHLRGTEDMGQFLYRLNRDRRFWHMPVLVTCAVHRMPDTHEISTLKLSDFLRKPFSFTDVGTKIRKYLA